MCLCIHSVVLVFLCDILPFVSMFLCVCVCVCVCVGNQMVTGDEGDVEPLHEVAVGEGEQNLVGQDGDGEQENGTHRHREGECAQHPPTPHSGGERERELIGGSARER